MLIAKVVCGHSLGPGRERQSPGMLGLEGDLRTGAEGDDRVIQDGT